MIKVKPYYWFSELYDHIYAKLVDYEAEANFLLYQYQNNSRYPRPNTILDIGCGTGSHLIEFAKYGIQTIGVDSSIVAVEKARLKFNGNGKIALQDMRLLDFGDKIDFAISMFSSFGYLESDVAIITVLKNLAHRIQSDGVIILELWQPDCIRDGYTAEINVPYKNGQIYRRSRFATENHDIINIAFDFVISEYSGGPQITVLEEHKIRTFTVQKIKELIEAAGMKLVSILKGGSFQEIRRFNLNADKSDFRIIVIIKP